MLDYNFRGTADRRSKAKLLSLEEEDQAIQLIENRFKYLESKEDELLLKTVIANYRNLINYVTFTDGLWVTEDPEKIIDPHKTLVRLGKSGNLKENNEALVRILTDLEETMDIESKEMELLAPVLNSLIYSCPVTWQEEALLQKFIDVYQNMEHYLAYTNGSFWFTDDKDKVMDPKMFYFGWSSRMMNLSAIKAVEMVHVLRDY